MPGRIGYSNKKFYYFASGRVHTFNMHMRIFLNEEPDEKILRSAIRKTLYVFPEMAIRPVIGSDGGLYFQKNDGEPAIFEENGDVHALGSDETNGYLFCVLLGEKSITVSFFHGLSDFVGNWSFICTILYHYASMSGIDVRWDKWIRLSRDFYDEMDEEERDDPYLKFSKASGEQSGNGSVFRIPELKYPEDFEMIHSYDVIMHTKDIFDKTKELETSFVPLLTAGIGRALNNAYNTGDTPVVTSVPVDLHGLYDTRTTANFSDSLMLKMTSPDAFGIKELCADLKDQMKRQLNRRFFSDKMSRVINRIDTYERKERDIEKISKSVFAEQVKPTRTYMLTYPGRICLSAGYDPIVAGFNMEPIVRNTEPVMFAGDYGEEFRIRICQDFDSKRAAEAIAYEMENIGINASFSDAGLLSGDYVDIGKIKRITG